MRDLMIGTRRPGQPRSWRAAVIGLGLLAAALVVTWFIFERSVAYEPPGDSGDVGGAVQWTAAGATGAAATGAAVTGALASGALTYRGSRLEWRGGIAVLHLAGRGQALGAAHGRLLAEQVPAVAEVAQRSFDELVRGSGSWARMTHALRVDWRLRFLDDGLGDLDRAIVAGLVRGAGLDEDRYGQLLRAQTVWDVGASAASSESSSAAASLVRSLAVVVPQASATGAAVAGRVWLGHAFSAPGLDDGGEALVPVVTFARPATGQAWASLGWPGDAGAVIGINASGLAIAVNPARTRDVRATRTARPTLLLARAVLEQASTLDEAVRTLENTATLGAASFVVVDGRAGKWAVVERSPARAVVVRPGAAPAALVLGDYLTSQGFAADPENDRTRRVSPSATRVTRAQQLLRTPLALVDQVAAVLRDRRTPDDVLRSLGHRGVPFDPAAQLAILDPSLMMMWVADPSAGGRMRAFDLRHELEGLGERPAPPPDIAADPSLEPGALEELRAARSLLRAARRVHAAGHLARARQLADRAVARAPSLPEALLLAGELAGAAGDHVAARRLLQAWIDGGPDDPDREQKVRAQLSNARGW
jgi:hypothetical protein